LDVSELGERWGLPIHLLDAIFYSETGRITAFESRGAALDIIKRLSLVIDEVLLFLVSVFLYDSPSRK